MTPPAPRRTIAAAIAVSILAGTGTGSARAQLAEIGPVEIGGALRVNLLSKTWETRERRFPRADAEFDTARLELRLADDGRWTGSVQWRLYYYDETDRTTSFPHHAWLGYETDRYGAVKAGLQQVPFGLEPYAANSYFFSIAYYVGLEDDYDVGLTWSDARGDWTFDAGYFVSDEGDWIGESADSARYSYDVVEELGARNQERDQINLRAVWSQDAFGAGAVSLGASLQAGRIPNGATGRDGSHFAAAAHSRLRRGRFELKLQASAYDYDLENPAGAGDDVVVMGAYDFPYRVAADGRIYSAALSWDAPVPDNRIGRWLESITLYEDFSVLTKSSGDFDASYHNVVGAALNLRGPVFIQADIASGRNNAWIGRDFGDALAGGGDGEWEHRFNINFGVYF